MSLKRSLHVEASTSAIPGFSVLTKAGGRASELAKVAALGKFDHETLVDPSLAKVVASLKTGTKGLGAGDLFWFSFVGHGAKSSLGEKGIDFMDEFLVLNDACLCDNDLFNYWWWLPEGTRILLLLDCCHAGGVPLGPPATDLFELLTRQDQADTIFGSVKQFVQKTYSCQKRLGEPEHLAPNLVYFAGAPEEDITRPWLSDAFITALTRLKADATYEDLAAEIGGSTGGNQLVAGFIGAHGEDMWLSSVLT